MSSNVMLTVIGLMNRAWQSLIAELIVAWIAAELAFEAAVRKSEGTRAEGAGMIFRRRLLASCA